MLNFGNVDTEIPLPNSTTRVLCPVCPSVECSKKKKKSNCGNAIVEIGGKKKRKYFFGNCGNGIAENGEKN